nr:hypothetical protein [Pantoea ananatis]
MIVKYLFQSSESRIGLNPAEPIVVGTKNFRQFVSIRTVQAGKQFTVSGDNLSLTVAAQPLKIVAVLRITGKNRIHQAIHVLPHSEQAAVAKPGNAIPRAVRRNYDNVFTQPSFIAQPQFEQLKRGFKLIDALPQIPLRRGRARDSNAQLGQLLVITGIILVSVTERKPGQRISDPGNVVGGCRVDDKVDVDAFILLRLRGNAKFDIRKNCLNIRNPTLFTVCK